MRTFRVSDVRPNSKRLPMISISDAMARSLCHRVEASGATASEACVADTSISLDRDGMLTGRQHQFLAAALAAFDGHYPLVLTPDVLWTCIIQGLAQHANMNSETLRDRLVCHADKIELKVIRDEFIKGSPKNDWPNVFSEFSSQIGEHIGAIRDMIMPQFTTTGQVELAASEIALMDVVKSYFTYKVMTRCGIPEVTLMGSPDDWIKLALQARLLARFDLGWWIKHLAPVLDAIAESASGNVDVAFWRSFCKRQELSGDTQVTGWINTLFPYVQVPGARTVMNPFIDSKMWMDASNDEPAEGPSTDAFPSGLSCVPFKWVYGRAEFAMQFTAGFVGYEQLYDLSLLPILGWTVSEPDASK